MDQVIFNSNRNYGRIMNSHLFANWNVIYSEFLEFKEGCEINIEDFCENSKNPNIVWCFQPMTIVEKPGNINEF